MEMACQENSFLLLENVLPDQPVITRLDWTAGNSPEQNEMGPNVVVKRLATKVYSSRTYRLSATRRPSSCLPPAGSLSVSAWVTHSSDIPSGSTNCCKHRLLL